MYVFDLIPCTFLDWENTFSLTGEHKMKKNTLLTTLPTLGKEFSIAFDLFISDEEPETEWRNVLHLTTGRNYGPNGSRVPGIWWLKSSKRLQLSASISGNDNYQLNHVGVNTNRWIKLEIKQFLRGTKVGMNGILTIIESSF